MGHLLDLILFLTNVGDDEMTPKTEPRWVTRLKTALAIAYLVFFLAMAGSCGFLFYIIFFVFDPSKNK